MKYSALIFAVGCLPLSVDSAFAETTTNPSVDNAFKAAKVELLELARDEKEGIVKQDGPIDRVGSGILDPIFEFSADSSDSRISLSFNLGITDGAEPKKVDVKKDGDIQNWSSLVMGIKASAPLAEGSETDSPFFSFGNLTTGSTLALSLNYFSTKLGLGIGAKEYLAQAYSRCFEFQGKKWAGAQANELTSLDAVKSIVDEYLAKAAIGGRGDMDAVWSAFSEEKDGTLKKHLYSKCITGANNEIKDETQLVEKYIDKNARRELRNTYVKSNSIFFGGLEGKLARQSFEAFDSAAFEKASVDRTGIEGAAYAGVIWPLAEAAIRGKVSYLKNHTVADEITICQTPAGGTQQCLTGPGGLPTINKSWFLALEGRKKFEVAGQPMAIAPQFTYDFSEKEWAVDFPVYLTRSAEDQNRLNGGIRFGYRSDQDDFGIGLFVGIPFSNWFSN